MSHVAQRIRDLEPSATLAVDAEAKRLKADGRMVIGFGAGEPDFATPEHIRQAAAEAVEERRFHGYTPASGLPELRRAIADRTGARWNEDIASSRVIVTNGGKHAAYALFQVLLDPGDEVIHQLPLWPTFAEVIRLAGGVPVGVPVEEQDSSWSIERLRAAITPRTKALLVVSPSNPTGVTWDDEALRQVADLADEHDLWIITDEIYDRLVYDQDWAPSLPVAAPQVRDRTIVLNGVSKTYAMTGWRVGWVLAPDGVASALDKLQGQMTSNVSNISQAAAIAALTGPQEVLIPMKRAFARRRDSIVAELRRVPDVRVANPAGAFYVYPDLRDVVDRLGLTSTAQFAEELLRNAGVALVPGEGFGTPGFARLSFALDDADLVTGVQRIAAFVRGETIEF